MRDRFRLSALTRLIAVQRARRAGAEGAFADALETERAACIEAQAAGEMAETAREEWRVYVSKPGFSPDYQRSLSGRLIGRDSEHRARTAEAAQAADAADRRRQEWQTLEAQVRSGEGSVHRLKRKIARRSEESRLGEVADRITSKWSRR